MKLLKHIFGAIFGWKGPVDQELPDLVLYYRSLEHRGFDQWLCWLAMFKQKIKTGKINGFCQNCPYWVPMTCLENNLGQSEDCGRGHYRFEAT